MCLLVCLMACLFVPSFGCSFVWSPCVCSFVCWFVCWFVQFLCMFVGQLACLVFLRARLFVGLFVYLCVRASVCSFVGLFTYFVSLSPCPCAHVRTCVDPCASLFVCLMARPHCSLFRFVCSIAVSISLVTCYGVSFACRCVFVSFFGLLVCCFAALLFFAFVVCLVACLVVGLFVRLLC